VTRDHMKTAPKKSTSLKVGSVTYKQARQAAKYAQSSRITHFKPTRPGSFFVGSSFWERYLGHFGSPVPAAAKRGTKKHAAKRKHAAKKKHAAKRQRVAKKK